MMMMMMIGLMSREAILPIFSADGGGWDQGEAEENKRAGLSENDNIPFDSFSLNVFLMFLHSNLLRKIMNLTVLHIDGCFVSAIQGGQQNMNI